MAFLSFRSDEVLSEWVTEQAKKRRLSRSDIMREALLQYKERQDSMEEAHLGASLDALKSEVGNMFRVSRTEKGLFLEKVHPDTIQL